VFILFVPLRTCCNTNTNSTYMYYGNRSYVMREVWVMGGKVNMLAGFASESRDNIFHPQENGKKSDCRRKDRERHYFSDGHPMK